MTDHISKLSSTDPPPYAPSLALSFFAHIADRAWKSFPAVDAISVVSERERGAVITVRAQRGEQTVETNLSLVALARAHTPGRDRFESQKLYIDARLDDLMESLLAS